MAHLPQDSLPSTFDVVVDGTGNKFPHGYLLVFIPLPPSLPLRLGLVQSILAAALSRVGKSVLHIDGYDDLLYIL